MRIQWTMWGAMPFTAIPPNVAFTSPANRHRGLIAAVAIDFGIQISGIRFHIILRFNLLAFRARVKGNTMRLASFCIDDGHLFGCRRFAKAR